MQQTGIYKNILVDVLVTEDYNLWVEMAYSIIRNSGIQRGGNDKEDSTKTALQAKKIKKKQRYLKLPKKC